MEHSDGWGRSQEVAWSFSATDLEVDIGCQLWHHLGCWLEHLHCVVSPWGHIWLLHNLALGSNNEPSKRAREVHGILMTNLGIHIMSLLSYFIGWSNNQGPSSFNRRVHRAQYLMKGVSRLHYNKSMWDGRYSLENKICDTLIISSRLKKLGETEAKWFSSLLSLVSLGYRWIDWMVLEKWK